MKHVVYSANSNRANSCHLDVGHTMRNVKCYSQCSAWIFFSLAR